LRDPDGNIWGDALLLQLHNDSQQELQQMVGQLQSVQAARVPSIFGTAYMHDWEWATADAGSGVPYKMGIEHPSGVVVTQPWESALLDNSDDVSESTGSFYSQPWEAWYASNQDKPVPVRLPLGFSKTTALYYDKEPAIPTTKEELMGSDPSWRNRSGCTYAYWRDENLSNHIHLYPMPTNPDWYDIDGPADYGAYVTEAEATVVVIDPEALTVEGPGDYGIVVDSVDLDGAVLAVFDILPSDLAAEDDESSLPVWMHRYIEFGTLERAYTANTDGQIESLRNYWAMRKEVALKAMQGWLSSRLKDRVFRLQTRGVPPRGTRGRPRLPDSYPAQW